MKEYLFLAKEVSDLNGPVAIGDAGIDRKMGIHKPHLITITLGDTSDEILHVTKGRTDCSRCLPRSKPSLHLQLSLPFLISDEFKIKIQMLEIANKLPTWPFHLDDLRFHLHGDPFGDVHGLAGEYGLHFWRRRLSVFSSLLRLSSLLISL